MPEPAAAPVVAPPSRYLNFDTGTHRFLKRKLGFIYAAFIAIFIASIVGISVFVVGHVSIGGGGSAAWSDWKPGKGSPAAQQAQIADHVSAEYKLNAKGDKLVTVISQPPKVVNGTKDVKISLVGVDKTAGAQNYRLVQSGVWEDEFCGFGSDCSIAKGAATQERGRLVRREALEIALYTFKYVSGISSIAAFMPPPPGETTGVVIFLEKSNYAKQLSDPLAKTLTLAKPPLPTAADTAESKTIDSLTLPSTYSWSLVQLQDGSAALALEPEST